jgi:hypothetical protein
LQDSDEDKRRKFAQVAGILKRRIDLLVPRRSPRWNGRHWRRRFGQSGAHDAISVARR